MPSLLIVEDDLDLNKSVCAYFEGNNYTVSTCLNGVEALKLLENQKFDLIISDIMMPELDGFSLVEKIRVEDKITPIIFMTARDDKFSKQLGYKVGIDDYVVKPFDIKELSARVKAVLRRTRSHSTSKTNNEVIKFENIEISLQEYKLKLCGKPVDIPPKELELLYFLAYNSNRVFTRDQLLDKVWGFDYLGDSRTVDVHVKRLREKLEGVSDKWVLKTVWGVGYKFEILE